MLMEKYEPLTETSFYILLCLSAGAGYGYNIMKMTGELSGGTLHLGPGTLYGALGKMQKKGWIVQTWQEESRKGYALTQKGGEVLDREIHRLEQMLMCARTVASCKKKGTQTAAWEDGEGTEPT